MRNQLNDNETAKVTGGNYFLNKNTMKVAFSTIPGQAFKLHGCSGNDAMEVMDALIGQYSTIEEYDRACVAALRQRGWID